MRSVKPTRMSLAFFLVVLSIIAGCAGNVILSEDAMRIRNAVGMIHQLENLYEQRDEGMLTLFTPEYLSGSGHRDAILKDMRRFSSISMNIFIDRMEMDKDMVNVTIHWNGSWMYGEKTLRSGGSAVFILSSEEGLKVADIKGDSPFGKGGNED